MWQSVTSINDGTFFFFPQRKGDNEELRPYPMLLELKASSRIDTFISCWGLETIWAWGSRNDIFFFPLV